jgi:HD-GYP domain-containing protein (c-di-GMP phosphodiesterase class II)
MDKPTLKRDVTNKSLAALRDRLISTADTLESPGDLDLDETLNYLLKLPEENRTGEAADALTHLARNFRNAGRVHDGLRAVVRARKWAASLDDQEVLFRAIGNESDLLMDVGAFSAAAAGRIQSWVLASEMGDVLRQLCAVGNIGILISGMGQHRAAIPYFERAREMAEQHGLPDFEFHSRSNIAANAIEGGDFSLGRRILSGFETEAPRSRLSATLIANTYGNLVRMDLMADDLASARLHLERMFHYAALARVERTNQTARLMAGLIDIRLGAVERGLGALFESLAFSKRASRADVSNILVDCVETHLFLGDTEKALDFLRELLEFRSEFLTSAIELSDATRCIALGQVKIDVANNLLEQAQTLEITIRDRIRLLMETAINAELSFRSDLFRIFRLGCLASHTAYELGWERSRVESLILGAQLCNVGLIAIPARIVQDLDEASAKQSAVLREHTLLGASLLRGSKLRVLDVAAVVAEQHHERFDGAGYPRGLQGDDISLESRIVSVCDAFDTMLHPTLAQSAALTAKEALKLLRRDAGSRFDPRVVDAFEKWVRRDLLSRKDIEAYLCQGADEFEYVHTRLRMERILADSKCAASPHAALQ